MREICFDTETTGVSPKADDRIVEIACVELFNQVPTGKEWQSYINPERDVPDEVVAIHGLTTDFLKDKPLFKDIADDFLKFIGDDPVIAHNAPFDMAFVNAELSRINRTPLNNKVIDTLREAKVRLGATARASLDALCRRYNIDLSSRTKHTALVDTRLLAQVYQNLMGGPNRSLEFRSVNSNRVILKREFRLDRNIGSASTHEIEEHKKFMEITMRKQSKIIIWDGISVKGK